MKNLSKKEFPWPEDGVVAGVLGQVEQSHHTHQWIRVREIEKKEAKYLGGQPDIKFVSGTLVQCAECLEKKELYGE